MSEAIEGAIDISIDTSWFGCLFFTSDRLIVARTEQKRYSPEHTGIIERWVYRKAIKEIKEKRHMYMTMHPENVLAADEKNFAIPYLDIAKVEMKKPSRVWTGNIMITTTIREEPYRYPLREGKEVFDKHVNLVRSLLPDKLSIT